ncbi:ribonuclease H-like domain-containing protein [Tanacetum coccineum]
MSQPANDEFSQHLSDDEASNHEDASDTGAAPKQQQQVIPQTTAISNIKLPILKKEEYDIWAMEMEHYLEYIDNDVWKVIQNGNSKKRISTGKDGVIRILPPVTAAEIQAVEKERKAKNILLMAIPKEHMRRFHGMDDAKEIWEAIRTRFGGNANSKKMQKAVFKQQFEAFTISSSEGLEKGYDRFQQLLSQLEAHGAEVSTEDCKFINVDTLSIDDLYNNLRVFEQEIQGASKTFSSAQNVAFVSQSKSSTNKVKSGFTGAYSTCTPSTSSTNIPEKEALAGFANEKLECFNCHNTGHFARECTTKGTHDGKKKRDSFYQHQEAGKQEKNQMGLLTMDDGIVNWGELLKMKRQIMHSWLSAPYVGSIGTSSEHSVDPDLRFQGVPHGSDELECYDERELGEYGIWGDDKINHASSFCPRSVILNSGRPNVNFVRPNVNTVRTNINFVRQNVNSVWSNVNTGSFNVNSVRPKQPVPTSNSPNFSSERPQVNKFNQRSNFSKSHSSVRALCQKYTAQLFNSHAVKGNWGSAVKTLAGYNWRPTRPNSNCNGGPNFIRTDHPLKNMVDEIFGNMKLGVKGLTKDLVAAMLSIVDPSAGQEAPSVTQPQPSSTMLGYIRAKLEANAELKESVLGKDLTVEDYAKRMRFGEELQTKTAKKLKFDDEGTQPTEEKIEEDKDDKPTKKTGKRRKQIARKGFHTDHDKDEAEDSDEANEKDDSTSGTKNSLLISFCATKSPSIANYKIIKQGRKGVYQIVRENGTDMVYISFGAMLTDISRDDLTELYRIVMKKHGMNEPEDEFEKVLWEYLKNMFEEPLSTDLIWSLPGQQRIICWRYYDACRVHCLNLESADVYMLIERKYHLSAEVCKAMLDKKLQGGKQLEYEVIQLLVEVKMDDPNITMKEYIRLEEEKASIVFNDTLTSETTLSYEPRLSSLNNDEIYFRISFDESDNEDCTFYYTFNAQVLTTKGAKFKAAFPHNFFFGPASFRECKDDGIMDTNSSCKEALNVLGCIAILDDEEFHVMVDVAQRRKFEALLRVALSLLYKRCKSRALIRSIS